MSNKVDIKELFAAMQDRMIAELNLGRQIDHATTQGDETELNWLGWVNDYLPNRYAGCKGFVVDHLGNKSEQIDIIIYDKQYSPLVFKGAETTYVTAESVYAIFEVKPILDSTTLKYAGGKAASVRKLICTSAPIVYSTGINKPKEPHRIIAGLLTTEGSWAKDATMIDNLKSLNDEQEIDLICSIHDIACRVIYERNGKIVDVKIDRNKDKGVLIFFFLTLLMKLQAIGTVPAIEYDKYFGDVSTIKEIYDDIQKANKD